MGYKVAGEKVVLRELRGSSPMYTTFTKADLASLVEKTEESLVDSDFCVCCKVAIAWEENTCMGCLDALADACAVIWKENIRVERGLYG